MLVDSKTNFDSIVVRVIIGASDCLCAKTYGPGNQTSVARFTWAPPDPEWLHLPLASPQQTDNQQTSANHEAKEPGFAPSSTVSISTTVVLKEREEPSHICFHLSHRVDCDAAPSYKLRCGQLRLSWTERPPTTAQELAMQAVSLDPSRSAIACGRCRLTASLHLCRFGCPMDKAVPCYSDCFRYVCRRLVE